MQIYYQYSKILGRTYTQHNKNLINIYIHLSYRSNKMIIMFICLVQTRWHFMTKKDFLYAYKIQTNFLNHLNVNLFDECTFELMWVSSWAHFWPFHSLFLLYMNNLCFNFIKFIIYVYSLYKVLFFNKNYLNKVVFIFRNCLTVILHCFEFFIYALSYYEVLF